jgi:hypothetical protein
LLEANRRAELVPTAEQLGWQLDLFQSEAFERAVRALGAVGGSEAERYLLRIAKREDLPFERRWSAVLALEEMIDEHGVAGSPTVVATLTERLWRDLPAADDDEGAAELEATLRGRCCAAASGFTV